MQSIFVAALCSLVVNGQLQSGSSWPMLGQNANHTGGSTSFLGPISTPMLSWSNALINTQEGSTSYALYSPVTAVISGFNYVFAITSRIPATIYGYSNQIGAPLVKVVHSTYGVGWGTSGSSPTIGATYGYFGDSQGNLCRFPIASGTQIETCMGPSYQTGGTFPGNPLKLPNGYPVSSPAVLQNGAVCVTTTFGSLHCASADLTKFGNIPYGSYFVNASNSPLFPTYAAGSAEATIYASPTLLNYGLGGYAYFGTGTSATVGYVFCIDINHIGDPDKAVVWSVAIPDGSGAVTSPVAGSSSYLYVVSAGGYAYQMTVLTGVITSTFGGTGRPLCGSGYLSSLTPAPLLFSQSGIERLAVSCYNTGNVNFLKADGSTFDSFSPGTGTCYLSAAGSYSFPKSGAYVTDTYVFSACSDGILYGLSTLYSSSTGSGGGLDSIATSATTGASLATYPTLLGDGSVVIVSTNGWMVSYVGQNSNTPTATASSMASTTGSISPMGSVTQTLTPTETSTSTLTATISASASTRATSTATTSVSLCSSSTPSLSATSSPSASGTSTVTISATSTMTTSASHSASTCNSATVTSSASACHTATGTNSVTTSQSQTNSGSATGSVTISATTSSDGTFTFSDSSSISGSSSAVTSFSGSASSNTTSTPTATPTPSVTPTVTQTPSLTSTLTMSRSLSPTPVVTLVYVAVAVEAPATGSTPSSIMDAGVAMVVIGVIFFIAAGTLLLYYNPAIRTWVMHAFAGGPPPVRSGGGGGGNSGGGGGGTSSSMLKGTTQNNSATAPGMPQSQKRALSPPSASSSKPTTSYGSPPSSTTTTTSSTLGVRGSATAAAAATSTLALSGGGNPSLSPSMSGGGGGGGVGSRGGLLLRNTPASELSPGDNSITRSSPLSNSSSSKILDSKKGGRTRTGTSSRSVSPRTLPSRRDFEHDDDGASSSTSSRPPQITALSPPLPPAPNSGKGNPFRTVTQTQISANSTRSISPRPRSLRSVPNDGIYEM